MYWGRLYWLCIVNVVCGVNFVVMWYFFVKVCDGFDIGGKFMNRSWDMCRFVFFIFVVFCFVGVVYV